MSRAQGPQHNQTRSPRALAHQWFGPRGPVVSPEECLRRAVNCAALGVLALARGDEDRFTAASDEARGWARLARAGAKHQERG